MSESEQPSGGLTIGIVGGSIAGCSAAIELTRAGYDVQVFERSQGELDGRGAGIGIPTSAIEALVERNLVDSGIPVYHVGSIRHIGRTSAGERLGHTAWVAPAQIELLNWGDIYHNLRRRVPEDVFHQGREVTATKNTDEGAELIFADGASEEFDLVVFADGYRSLGRRSIYRGADVRYRGYILWRGVLDEKELDDSDPLEAALCRVGYAEGHAVFNFVPGADGSVQKGRRWVNWAMYMPMSESDLPQFLVDKTGERRPGTLPPGSIRPEEVERLTQLAQKSLPPYFSDIIAASRNTFAQPIHTTSVPAYYKGRICLAGDAGAFAQPFTSSGVFKGINNAIGLSGALTAEADVDKALAAWNAEEIVTGTRMYLLGQQLEEALIWKIPNFATMSEAQMKEWWENAAKLPEDMFPPE